MTEKAKSPHFIIKPDIKMAKVFSDKTRIKILDELASQGEVTNTGLSKKLGLSKATMSHHLKVLSSADIVYVSRVKKEEHGIPMKFYSLKSELIPVASGKEKRKEYALIHDEIKREMKGLISKKTLRKGLGDNVGIAFMRVVKSALSRAGVEEDAILYDLGYDLGRTVFSEEVKGTDIEGVLTDLKTIWEVLKLGYVSIVEKSDEMAKISVIECYDCMDLPNIGKPLCFFDTGIIAGVFDEKLGRKHSVKETKCWGLGNEVCEFEIRTLQET